MMPRSLLAKTFYQKRKFILGWFIGLLAMTILTLSFFPSFKNGALGQSLSNLSPAAQKIVGNVDSFKTIGGYIGQQLFALRIPLLLTILAIVLFGGLTVGDERKGLLETQLSLPLSRLKILTHKLLAGIAIIVIASTGVFVGVVISLAFLGEHYSLLTVLQEVAGTLLVSLCFGLIAFMLGASFGKRGLAVGLASAFAFLSYLISSLVAAVPGLKDVEKASLFHYQTPPIISPVHALVLGATALVLIAISLVLFNRRDIGV